MDELKETQLRLIIQAILGMPENSVRPQDNQPSEGDQFAIVQFAESQLMGWSGSGVGAKQSGTITYNIDFMGLNSSKYATQLKIAMQYDYATSELQKIDLGFISVTDPTNLTALEMDQMQRSRVKLTLSFAEKYILEPNQTEIPTIESVPIGFVAEP